MRNLKKILALVLALMMVLSVMVTASAAYSDADEITQTQAVEVLSELEILLGKGDNFDPNGTLTRAEAATILTKIMLGENFAKLLPAEADALTNNFTDTATHWGLDYIKYCASQGLIIGNGKGQFDPNGKLTGYAFGKMLLIAIGVGETADYLGDAYQTWETKVLADLKDEGLLAGLPTGLKLSANLSRENAARMALNALTYVSEGYYGYPVYAGQNQTGIILGYYDSLVEAHFAAQIMGGSYGVELVSYATNYLLKTNFDTTKTTGTDEYGRVSTVYTYNKDDANEYTKYYPVAAVAKYTTKTTAATVAADIAGYYMFGVSAVTNEAGYYNVADDTVGNWAISVKADSQNAGTSTNLYAAAATISALTGYNKTVEVYTDLVTGLILDTVVVIETHDGVVTGVTPANPLYGTPATITIDNAYVTPATGLAVGTVVTYNKYVVAGETVVENVAAAPVVVGTLTKYTADGKYTINGTEYLVDDTSVATAAIAKYGVEAKYYLGANGSIIRVGDADAAAALTNYAKIIDANITGDGVWAPYTVMVKVLMGDGTVGTYSVPVILYQGQYVINLGGVPTPVANLTAEALKTETVYTYAVDGTSITLADTVDAYTTGTGNYLTTAGSIAVGATNTSDVVINNNTLFIVKTANGYKTVKGSAGLPVGGLTETMEIVYSVTKVGPYTFKTALIVFANENTVTLPSAVLDTTNYVLVDGNYTVEYDATVANYVYSYTGVKADGTAVVVRNIGSDVGEGLYAYDAATGLISSGNQGNHDIISGVYNNVYSLYSGSPAYVAVSANVKVVDLVGNGVGLFSEIIYKLDANGLVDLIYVIG